MTINKLLALGLLACLAAGCGSPEERAAKHLESAEALYEEGDLIKARLEAQNAAQIQPKSGPARLLLAKIAEEDGEFREAIGHLLVAIESDPELVEARVKLGTYYFLGQAADEAAEQAREALRLAPDNAQARLLDARVKLLQGDRQAAAAATESALELDPRFTDAIMFRSGLLAEGNDQDAALQVIDQAIADAEPPQDETLRQFRMQLYRLSGQNEAVEAELEALAEDYPDKPDYKIALAQFYSQLERQDDAEQVLQELIVVDPDNVDRKLDLVRLQLSTGDLEQAEETLTGFASAEPENQRLALALAALYERAEQQDRAEGQYRQVAALDSASEDGLAARNRLVALAVQSQRADEARSINDAILDEVPDNPDALLVRAAFEFTEQRYDDAIADLRVVLRQDESSERALLLLARSYVGNRDLVLAQDTYRRLLAVNPSSRSGTEELASLLANQGNPQAAEEVLRARLDLAPDDERAATGLVQTLLAQQDLTGAESEARRLLDVNSNNVLAQFQLGRVLQAKGSVDEAVEAYKLTLEREPNAIAALQGLASVLAGNNRAQEAIDYVSQYVQDKPDVPAARLLLGSLYAGQGRVDDAREVYEALLVDEPAATRVYAALAALESESSPERRAIYRRGLEAAPDSIELALLLATELERGEAYGEAIALYDDLIERNPENLIVVNNLAALLLDHRTDPDSHQRALDLARQLESTDQPAFLDTLAWAHYRNGDYPRAVRLSERAVAGAGQVAVLRYHLGMAYARNNNPVGAKQELRAALENPAASFPGVEEARETLAELEAS